MAVIPVLVGKLSVGQSKCAQLTVQILNIQNRNEEEEEEGAPLSVFSHIARELDGSRELRER